MITLICHTPGCENNDVAIEVDPAGFVDDEGTRLDPFGYICGACSQAIADVADDQA